jgi:hypothetical protein
MNSLQAFVLTLGGGSTAQSSSPTDTTHASMAAPRWGSSHPPPKRKGRLRAWFGRRSSRVQGLMVTGFVVVLIGGAAIIGLVNNTRN